MALQQFRTFLVSIAILFGSAIHAIADPVTLSAHDGSAEITGELVSFSDGVYSVLTMFGTVQMSASRVSCIGEDCPVLVANSDDSSDLN